MIWASREELNIRPKSSLGITGRIRTASPWTHNANDCFFLGFVWLFATQLALLLQQERIQVVRSYFFGSCYADTQLAIQLNQEHTQVVCSSREARKHPAWGHSCNGPWTWRHTCTHTQVDKQKRNRTIHVYIKNMDEQHTLETAINFVFYPIYLVVSLYISCLGLL